VHQVGSSLHDYIEMHGQQNIKYIANIPCHHKYLIPTLKTTAAFDWTVLVLYCHYDITRWITSKFKL